MFRTHSGSTVGTRHRLRSSAYHGALALLMCSGLAALPLCAAETSVASGGATRSIATSLASHTTRAAGLTKIGNDAALRKAVAALLNEDYSAAFKTSTERKADAQRLSLSKRVVELHAQLVEQKKVVGGKFPVAETKPDFLKLVQIHQEYFAAVVAWDQHLRSTERPLLALRDGLRTVDPAAKPSEPGAAMFSALPDEVKTKAGELYNQWTRAKQVYLFNLQGTTAWAKDFQRTCARWHNGYRLIHNLNPAELHPKLNDAQQKHHDEMAALKYWDHVSPVAENKTWDKRIRNEGYDGGAGSENLAAGSGMGANDASARMSVIMWFWDPHHHPLINAGFNQLGVGAAPGMLGCSYGSNKKWQSEGYAVNEIDLSVLIVIDYKVYAAAFAPRDAAKR